MALHMQSQMIRTRKTPIALCTFERFGASVFPVMASQFVGAGKPPFTAGPRTLVWLLTCMSPEMRLEMRTLGVHLFASEKRALVDPPLYVGFCGRPSPHPRKQSLHSDGRFGRRRRRQSERVFFAGISGHSVGGDAFAVARSSGVGAEARAVSAQVQRVQQKSVSRSRMEHVPGSGQTRLEPRLIFQVPFHF